MSRMDECLRCLEALGIEYELIRHEALDTMEKCRLAEEQLHVSVPRNIFLCTRNQRAFALLTLNAQAPFRTSDISKQAGMSRLSFASAERMDELLGTYPGALSPLGLMFDTDRNVRFLLDQELVKEPFLGFHPVDNRATVKLATQELLNVFLPACGHEAHLVSIHSGMEGK